MGLAKRIIPCLDVDQGRVVKGVRFKNIRDAGDPVEVAQRYNDQGADELVMLDIGASFEERGITLETVVAIAGSVFIPLTVGGGVSKPEHVGILLRSGADKVAINTAGVNNPNLIKEAAKIYGSQCIVAAIDAKRENNSWRVYTHGGRTPSKWDAIKWAQHAVQAGAGEILLTSMDADGTNNGFDLALTHAVSSSIAVPVIASGGAGCKKHILEVIQIGLADAVLAASIFHYEQERIMDVKRYINFMNTDCMRPHYL